MTTAAVPPASPPAGWRLLGIRLGIVLATSALLLLLCELGVRWLAPQPLTGRWSDVSPRGIRINQANWTARHHVGDYQVRYRFNADHLRGGPTGPQPRVLCLGDSVTFGWLLEESECFVGRLGALAERDFGPGRVALLNGGRAGWGAADYVAFVEEFGPRLRPRVIVVFYNFEDIERSLRSPLFVVSDPAQEILEARSAPASLWTTWANQTPGFGWLLENSHFVQLSRRSLLLALGGRPRPEPLTPEGRFLPQPPEEIQRGLVLGRALFRRLAAWCRDHECQLLVMTPGLDGRHVPRVDLVGSHDVAFRRQAPAFFAELDVPYHDLIPAINAAVGPDWRPFIIPDDLHPNPRLSQLIAGQAWLWLGPQLRAALRISPE